MSKETFVFKCPQCQGEIEAKYEYCGQVVRCPHCEKGIVVPKLATSGVNVVAENPNEGKMKLKTVAEQRISRSEYEVQHQHESVEAVEERWRKEERKRRTSAMAGSFFGMLKMLLALAVLGAGGWFAWEKFFKDRPGKEELPVEDVKPPQVVDKDQNEAAKREAEKRLERERQLAERKSADERKKAEAQEFRERKAAYDGMLKEFATAPLDFWKNAPESERPGKAKTKMVYRCLLPGESNPLLLELRTEPGKPMEVFRLSPTADPVAMPLEDFQRMIEDVPYLVKSEEIAYFCCSKKLDAERRTFKVPMGKGEFITPSAEVLGSFTDVINSLRFKRPAIKVKVSFVAKGASGPLDICTVGYGDRVDRNRFKKEVRKELERLAAVAAKNQKESGMNQIKRKKKIYGGTTIQSGMDGVQLIPSAYKSSTSSLKRKLYEEAEKEEIAARQAQRNASGIRARRVEEEEVDETLDSGHVKIEATFIK